MGRDKCHIHLDGVPLFRINLQKLRRVLPTVVISGDSDRYRDEGFLVLDDLLPGIGPMGGLYTALKKYPGRRVLLLAADIPLLPESLLLALRDHPARDVILLPAGRNGGLEPLAAVYPPAVLPLLEALISEGNYAMHSLFFRYPSLFLAYEKMGIQESSFLNLNRPEDLLRLREVAGRNIHSDGQHQ
jgi:molybdopterin-guanine dinucleotide biosynthesis protein A